MNIRQKCISVIAVSLVISAALNMTVLRFAVFPSFIEMENESAIKDIQRVTASIQSQLSEIDKITKVYSTWDDAYFFVTGKTNTYVETTLYYDFIKSIGVNLVSIHDRDGKLVYEAAYEADAEEPSPAGALALSEIDPEGTLLTTSDDGARLGLLMTGRGPLLVASRPILLSNGDGPHAGTFIMGRYLEESLVADLNELTHMTFELRDADPDRLNPADKAALSALLTGDEVVIDDASEGALAVYVLMRDVNGQPALLARATIKRGISQTGMHALFMAVGGIGVAGLVVMAVAVALLQILLVGPISHLTQHLLAIGGGGDLSRRLTSDRNDEIGTLSREFDGMLQKLDEARSRLLEQSYSAGIAEMASGVLHNIRNQLAPLSMRVERLQASVGQGADSKLSRAIEELKSPATDPERKQKMLQFIELSCTQTSSRQTDMINELKSVAQDFLRIEHVLSDLDRFSRADTSATEVNLIDVIRETADMLPKYPDIEVIIRIDHAMESFPSVSSEPFVLKHVLQNMAVNSIESMIAAGRERGTIKISAASKTHDSRACIDLQVQDEGIGIAADKLETIFTRGFSTKKEGHRGTGLHWCANSMLAIGGKIFAESPGPQKGATMHLIIPIARQQAQAAA